MASFLPFYEMKENNNPWLGIWPGVVQATSQTFSYKVEYSIFPKEMIHQTATQEWEKESKEDIRCFVDSIN